MLEVCVESLQAMRIAVSAGADRIELCEQLHVGGVTPSRLLLDAALELASSVDGHGPTANRPVPIIALIRCRAGDFVYDNDELGRMLEQAQLAIDLGCHGIAVGASTSHRELDWGFLEAIAKRHSNSELVIHRVFDGILDPMGSVPQLIELGYRRILTSGGGEHAFDSLEKIRELQERFADRMEILPGGGVSSSNASRILEATGCKQLHGSFRDRSLASSEIIPDPEEIRRVRAQLSASL